MQSIYDDLKKFEVFIGTLRDAGYKDTAICTKLSQKGLDVSPLSLQKFIISHFGKNYPTQEMILAHHKSFILRHAKAAVTNKEIARRLNEQGIKATYDGVRSLVARHLTKKPTKITLLFPHKKAIFSAYDRGATIHDIQSLLREKEVHVSYITVRKFIYSQYYRRSKISRESLLEHKEAITNLISQSVSLKGIITYLSSKEIEITDIKLREFIKAEIGITPSRCHCLTQYKNELIKLRQNGTPFSHMKVYLAEQGHDISVSSIYNFFKSLEGFSK